MTNLKSKFWIFMAIVAAAGLSACAHHKDVHIGSKGIHSVEIESASAKQGAQAAIEQAQHFCESKSLKAVFLKSQPSKKKAAQRRVASAKKKVDQQSRFGSGTVQADEQDYVVHMDFKCR